MKSGGRHNVGEVCFVFLKNIRSIGNRSQEESMKTEPLPTRSFLNFPEQL